MKLSANAMACACAIVICTMGASFNANAQWYVSVNGGVNVPNDSDFTDTGQGAFSGAVAKGSVSFDSGYVFTGALGYAWGPLRIEGEVGSTQTDLDTATINSVTFPGAIFTGAATADLGGDVSAVSFLVNGWYDFDAHGKWVPFIGGGIGAADINLTIKSLNGGPLAPKFDESDTVLAYQLGAGVGYRVTPSTMLRLSYRYFGTSDPTFESSADKIDTESSSHSVMLGVTVQF